MRPAHLRAAHHGIGKVIDQLAQTIRLRNKVGVENREKFTLRGLHAILKRAGLEARAIQTVNVFNVKTELSIFIDGGLRQLHGFVSGIVKHLNLQPLTRIIDLGNCLHQPLDNIHLIKQRQLNGNYRQLCFAEDSLRLGNELAITPEVDDLFDAIATINRQHAEDCEIENQDSPVEGVELIERTDIAPGLIRHILEVAREKFIRRGAKRWLCVLEKHLVTSGFYFATEKLVRL